MDEGQKCLIRGHNHELKSVKWITQKGTGAKAQLLECPTGRYRFFVLEGREPCRELMFTRPRYGWTDYTA